MDHTWMQEERQTNGSQKSKATQHPTQAPRAGVAGSPPAAAASIARAVRSPQALSPADVLALQRTIGNAAVNQLLRSAALQRETGAVQRESDDSASPKRAAPPSLQRGIGGAALQALARPAATTKTIAGSTSLTQALGLPSTGEDQIGIVSPRATALGASAAGAAGAAGGGAFPSSAAAMKAPASATVSGNTASVTVNGVRVKVETE